LRLGLLINSNFLIKVLVSAALRIEAVSFFFFCLAFCRSVSEKRRDGWGAHYKCYVLDKALGTAKRQDTTSEPDKDGVDLK